MVHAWSRSANLICKGRRAEDSDLNNFLEISIGLREYGTYQWYLLKRFHQIRERGMQTSRQSERQEIGERAASQIAPCVKNATSQGFLRPPQKRELRSLNCARNR